MARTQPEQGRISSIASDNQIATDTSSAGNRIPALDSLRGIAILMVLAAHFLAGTLLQGLPGALVDSFGTGGVVLFFLLSGYLIFRNVERQSTRIFLERRFFKLFPAYWINVGVIALMGATIADYPKFSSAAYFANFVMMPDIFKTELIAGNYWTLVIEIKFYLLLALQYRLLGARHVLAAPAGIMLVNFVFWLAFGRGSILLSYLCVFYIGIEIYRAEIARWQTLACMRMAMVTLTVAASMLLFLREAAGVSAIYIVLVAALFILTLQAKLRCAWLGYFGRISYSLYLYHGVLGYELFRHFAATVPMVALVPVAYIVSIAAAHISFIWVEVPGVGYGREREKRRQLRTIASAQLD